MALKMYTLRGLLLIAMPSLQDPYFTRAVVMMIDHNAHGAFGLVLNRPQKNLFVSNILSDLQIPVRVDLTNEKTYFGGPVGSADVFVLHETPFVWQGCEMITDQIALTSSRDILEAIAVGEGPSSYRVILGSSGWVAGQLEEELKQHTWLTCPANTNLLFHTDPQQCWEGALKNLGISEALLSVRGGEA